MKILRFALMMMLLLAATGFAGCGGDQTPTENKKIIIGIDDDFPPMGFRNEQGEIVGFDIDLAKETFKRMDVDFEFKPIDWSKKREEITSGNIDLIWNGLDITDDRKEYMIFSKSYMDDRQIFLVKKNSNQGIYSEEDLEGKIVGVQAGATSETYFNQNEELKNTFKDFKTYNKFREGIDGLKNGEIDVFICDEVVARYEMKMRPNQFDIIYVKTGFPTEVAIGFSKNNAALCERVQKIFDEMIKDGTAKKISEDWFQADLIKSGI